MRDQQALTSADANLTLEQTEQRRQLGRLRRIADDPTWSPVLRMYAKRLAYEGGVLTDDDIRAVLVDRINRRAAMPGTPDDPAALRARFARPSALQQKDQPMSDSQPSTEPSIVERYRVPKLMRDASADEQRAAVITGIRALAQMLEDHPDLPTPYNVSAQAGPLTDAVGEQEWQQKRSIVIAAATSLGLPLGRDTATAADVDALICGYDVRYVVLALRRPAEHQEDRTDG